MNSKIDIKVLGIDELLGDYAPNVTYDGETIGVFGNYTKELERKYCDHIKRKTEEKDVKFRDKIQSWLEHQVMLGGVLANTMDPQGIVYEYGCGLGIPSITYSLLTGNEVYLNDNDEAELKESKEISRNFNLSKANYELGDAFETLPFGDMKEGDTVFVSNPGYYDLLDGWFYIGEATPASLMCSVYSHILAPPSIVPLGTDELVLEFERRYGSFLEHAGLTDIIISEGKCNPLPHVLAIK